MRDLTAVDVSSLTTFDLPDAGATGWFGGASIMAGADAASAVFTEKTTGRFLGAVSALLGAAGNSAPPGVVRYVGGIVITKTGTAPKVVFYQG